jgi:hypothetical protein
MMANKVEIIVVAKDETKPTFDKVKAEGKKAGEDAGKGIGDGIKKGMADTRSSIERDGIAPISVLIGAQQRLEKATQRSADAVTKFGADSKEAADATATLARAHLSVESSAKNAAAALGTMTPELHKMLSEIGLAGPQIDNLGQSLESGFKKLASTATTEGANVGKSLGESMSKSTTEEVGKLGGSLMPVLGGVIAAAAPFLGSLLAAGVLGATGVGAMVAGIVVAFKDPAIMNAAGEAGKTAMRALTQSAEVFKGPLLDAIKSVQSAFGPIADNISSVFGNAAKWVKPAADAIASFAQSVSGGLANAVAAAGPVMQQLFDGLKQVGTALGDFFTEMSQHGPEAALALQIAFAALVVTIEGIAKAVGLMADAFGFIAQLGLFGQPMAAEFAVISASADTTVTSTESVQNSFSQMIEKSNEATGALKTLGDALKAQTDPMFALIKAQEDYAAKQKASTDAVNKYGSQSSQAKDAALKLAEAAIGLQSATGKAADSFNGKLTPSMRATLTAAGLTKQQINQVEAAFKAAHSQGNAFAKTYTATVVTNYVEHGTPAQVGKLLGKRTGGSIGAAMSGGIQGNLTLVGEDGPELVSLPYGSSVKTAGATSQALEDALAPKRQNASSPDPDAWGAVLTELRLLRTEVSRSGNGDVYLDSRLVGAVQGRQADIYERAG